MNAPCPCWQASRDGTRVRERATARAARRHLHAPGEPPALLPAPPTSNAWLFQVSSLCRIVE